MEKDYYVLKPELQSDKATQDYVGEVLKEQETDFYKQQLSLERDYCFWLEYKQTAKPHSLEHYMTMAHTLTNADTLGSAATQSFILNEEDTLHIHTVKVIRNGQVIDKLADCDIKVMDYIGDSSSPGVFNNDKQVTILIPNLRLNDVYIMETTRVKEYKHDSLKNIFFRDSYTYPTDYWAYGKYRFRLLNQTGRTIEANYHYFRDEEDRILEKDSVFIENEDSFVIDKTNYIGEPIKNNQITPFIDFSTKMSYEVITTEVAKIYDGIYQHKFETFGEELIKELDSQPTMDDKIKLAIDFVQKEVYYLYNEVEMDGHIPQLPDKTFSRRQGDCKAKTVLLKVILDYLGVESNVVLVNYRADIFLPVYTPSPLIFNHAILKIYYNDTVYFVDATLNEDYGYLGRRQKDSFIYYLEIKPNTTLQIQDPFINDLPDIEEVIHIDVLDDKATLSMESKLRKNSANTLRSSFKNQTKRDIIQRFMDSVHYNMKLFNNFDANDIHDYFSDATIDIQKDDKNLNELSILFKTTIDNPYLKNNTKKKYLLYWDRVYFINDDIDDYHHEDFPLWVDRPSVKMQVHLFTDKKIDQNEYYTNKEAELTSKYLNHSIKKKIEPNGASIFINHETYRNLPISGEDLEEYAKTNKEILDSNLTVGIDILPESMFSKIKNIFK
ncbi:hypothetical protein BW731_11755 [Vagococcus martis]|uniref:DUF3857 domain-containing protein n=1 Tax=Vagococcus martis TaxID=1768210 RepID=A0A1V4DKD1_9ENTE|nr:hypothetical protein [Vagococcus martis]OPF88796.1 hypothetical protein BW731_11755 [Vagococcus martis]